MAEIKDLQKLIEERAKAKLIADMKQLVETLGEQPLLNYDTPRVHLRFEKDNSQTPTYEPYHIIELIRMGSGPVSYYAQRLYDYWLPIYIEKESAEFLQKVDQLQEDVQQLFSDTQNLQNNG